MMTFVQATNVQATIVHIGNISAVIDSVLTNFLYPIFLGSSFLSTYFFCEQNSSGPNIFEPKVFRTKLCYDKKILVPRGT